MFLVGCGTRQAGTTIVARPAEVNLTARPDVPAGHESPYDVDALACGRYSQLNGREKPEKENCMSIRSHSVRIPLSVVALLLVGCSQLSAQRTNLPPPASFTAPSIPGVVAAGTKIELIKSELSRTEGPVGMPDGSVLVSSTDSILKVDAAGNVTTFIAKSNQTNAMGYDPQGRLVSVQRARNNEKVGVLYPPGSEATLVDTFEGKPLSRLNDMVMTKNGGVYFTDAAGVYYLPPGGRVTRVIDSIKNPNGVILSPDEKTLYANDKDGLYLLAFDVAADGSVSNRRNFAEYKSLTIPGHKDPLLAEDNGADGMAIDNDGRVYVATNAGVEVFSPRGELLGVIATIWGAEKFNLQKPQNLAFAGPDRKTLYIVGAGTIFKMPSLAQGVQGRAK
jgi:gluconolactonase